MGGRKFSHILVAFREQSMIVYKFVWSILWLSILLASSEGPLRRSIEVTMVRGGFWRCIKKISRKYILFAVSLSKLL